MDAKDHLRTPAVEDYSKAIFTLESRTEEPVSTNALAERLAQDFPDARIELIEDSYTFVAIDQPARTAELIGQFAGRALSAAV